MIQLSTPTKKRVFSIFFFYSMQSCHILFSCYMPLPFMSRCVYVWLYVVSVSVRVSELHLSEHTSHPLIPSTIQCFPVS